MFRGALRLAVSGAVEGCTIIEAADLQTVQNTLTLSADVDLVLLDLNMPGAKGFSGLMMLRAQYPAIPVIIVSGNTEAATVGMAMELGASGFIPKTTDFDTMRGAMRCVLDGGTWLPPGLASVSSDQETALLVKKLASLTPQQMRVLMMLSDGLLNKQIAWQLEVSEATVKAHVSAILQKLDVDSRTQAVIAANRISAAARPPGGSS